MIWKGSLGNGRVLTAPWQKRQLLRNQLVPIPLTGEKNGTKRHILVDERGVPLSIVVTGANRHDVTQIEPVLKNRIRKPRGRTQQNLCADAGYSGEKSENIMRTYHYTPHIRPRGEEKIAIQHGFKARRWIVEVVHSWFNRFSGGRWNMRTSKSRSMSACRNSALVSSIMWIFTTPGGFIRHSNIGRRMKSISELAIGKQWDIVNQGSLHQSFHKSCPT